MKKHLALHNESSHSFRVAAAQILLQPAISTVAANPTSLWPPSWDP
jgi:hypothetical protein